MIEELSHPAVERTEVDGTEETLQLHSYHPASGGAGGANAGPALFHGQGGVKDLKKRSIAPYFNRVATAVQTTLAEQRLPLVLCCVDSLAAIYRSVNTYPFLVDDFVAGSANRLAREQIHAQAWHIISDLIDERVRQAESNLIERVHTPLGSDDIHEILWAAQDGRVDSLFLRADAEQWGRIDQSARTFELTNNCEDEELLDFIASRVLSCRGRVFTAESVPGTSSSIAALYRFSLEPATSVS